MISLYRNSVMVRTTNIKSVGNSFRKRFVLNSTGTTLNTNAAYSTHDLGHNGTVFETNFKWSSLWLIGCVFLATGCVAISVKILVEKYHEQHSTLLVFSNRPTDIWEIPFPAITICPSTKIQNVKQYSWFLFCKQMPNSYFCRGFSMKNKETELKAAALVCYNNTKLLPDDIEPFADTDTYAIIRKVALKMDDLLKVCLSRSAQSCDRLFHETMTDSGLCYTYNMLSHSEFWREKVITTDFQHQLQHTKKARNWNAETGLFNSSAKMGETYPRRAVGAEYDKLMLFLTLRKDNIDADCDDRPHGYKLLFHSPDEYPLFGSHKFQHIDANEIFRAHVIPKITQTTTNLQNINAQSRKCYFMSERYLKFFKNYNQLNCEVECLANITLHECGCVNFALPRALSTPICGLGKERCSKSIKKSFLQKDIARNECDCMPKCGSVEYDIEVKSYGHRIVRKASVLESEIIVSFKHNHFDSQLRVSKIGAFNMLCCTAGILKLFVGVSLISILHGFGYWARYLWSKWNCKTKRIRVINQIDIFAA